MKLFTIFMGLIFEKKKGRTTSGKEDIMKKKILTMVIVLCVAMSMLAGCSSKSRQSSADASEFTGTVDEIKDFMLVVTDADDTSYAFTFESKPDGLEDVAVGDTVTVTYTGTVSEAVSYTHLPLPTTSRV